LPRASTLSLHDALPICRFPEGTREDALRAVEAASAAFEMWSRTPAEERWKLLQRIAAILRNRKHEFSAMMVLEESKSWPEADGRSEEHTSELQSPDHLV